MKNNSKYMLLLLSVIFLLTISIFNNINAENLNNYEDCDISLITQYCSPVFLIHDYSYVFKCYKSINRINENRNIERFLNGS